MGVPTKISQCRDQLACPTKEEVRGEIDLVYSCQCHFRLEHPPETENQTRSCQLEKYPSGQWWPSKNCGSHGHLSQEQLWHSLQQPACQKYLPFPRTMLNLRSPNNLLQPLQEWCLEHGYDFTRMRPSRATRSLLQGWIWTYRLEQSSQKSLPLRPAIQLGAQTHNWVDVEGRLQG